MLQNMSWRLRQLHVNANLLEQDSRTYEFVQTFTQEHYTQVETAHSNVIENWKIIAQVLRNSFQ